MNLPKWSYGPDTSGLICGYRFSSSGAGEPLDVGQVVQWLAQERSGNDPAFVWLHFNLSVAATEEWLKRHLVLSDVFYETLHDGIRSTRIEYVDDTLIAVVNDVLYDFSLDASEISTLWISANRQLLVSVRRKPLRSVDRLHAAVKAGQLFRSPTDLLVHLLRDQAEVLVQIVRDTVTKVDSIEDRLLADRLDNKRVNLGALRRVLVRLQRLLAPEPGSLFRLLNRPPEWINGDDIQELRHSSEEFAAVLNDMAALQERIKLLQEEIAAHINEQNNRSLFVLTIVTVLALPINIMAGLFGMNVGGIPLAQHEYGFWIVVAIVATVTAIAGWLAFRRRDN